MSQFTYALQERSDDGQIDEILGLSDNLVLLEDVVHARIRDVLRLSESAIINDARDAARVAFQDVVKTPRLTIEIRHEALDRMFTVTAAPFLSVGYN